MGVNAVKIISPGFGEIHILSIYGNLFFSNLLDFHLAGVIGTSLTTIKAQLGEKPTIIAGDFNIDRRMDDNPTGTRFSKKDERRCNFFFDFILDLGFEDCLRMVSPDYIQTYRPIRGNYPWELDHMFATPSLTKKMVKLKLLKMKQ